MEKDLKFLDLFAGAGGLSEGFVRAGFHPLAHVEVNKAACNTLKTRMAYYWLRNNDLVDKYYDYLYKRIPRYELYQLVPKSEISSVINEEISQRTLSGIFDRIDQLLGGKSLDLIIGGPPCQTYSLVGRSRDKNGMRGDKRNYLYTFYAKFLNRYKPRYFVFENVSGLLSAKINHDKSYLDHMRNLFKTAGYITEYKVLNAFDYGVLQKRKRIILVGRQTDISGYYPEPKTWNLKAKVKDVLDDLPNLQAGEGSDSPCEMNGNTNSYLRNAMLRTNGEPVTWHQARPHNERDKEIYRIAVNKWNKNQERLDYNDLPEELKTHRNRSSFLDRFKVVGKDLQSSHTVVAHISKDGHYYIHPDINQNRSLTPREAARLQTFPDDYYFESENGKPSRTHAFFQIGNAVPVLLAQRVAEKMIEVW